MTPPSRPVEAAGPNEELAFRMQNTVALYDGAFSGNQPYFVRQMRALLLEAAPIVALAVPVPPADTPTPPSEPTKRTGCNRHDDCEQAEKDRLTRHPGTRPPFSFHCHNDECEECFGN